MTESIKSFLDKALHHKLDERLNSLHVTLTFAQSVDGKIAGKERKQLRLSCDESMLMTHRSV